MRFKTTFILLILNLALAGTILYLNRVQDAKGRFLLATKTVVEQSLVESADRFEIVPKGGSEKWVFVKENERWIVESPFRWPANPYAIERLIGILSTLRWETQFSVESLAESNHSLENYGLANADSRITLFSSGNEPVELVLGSPTEIGNRLYVLSPDKQYIQVLDQSIIEGIGRDIESFYDLNVFSLSPEETRALQIQDRSSSNVRVRITRTNQGWRIASPIDTPANASAVVNSLLNITSQEIMGFDASAQNTSLFETPILRLVLEGFNTRETLLFANPSEDSEASYVLAKRESYPTVFKLPISFLEQLRRAQEELRERRILVEMQKDWTALEIRMGSQSTILQRLENGQWQVIFTGSDDRIRTLPAEQKVVDDLREDIMALQAVQFVTDAPSESDITSFGLLDPQRTLLFRKEGRPEVELKIGNLADSETLLYAKTNFAPTVSLVRPFILAEAPLNPLYYRERTLTALPESLDLVSIRFIRIADQKDFLNNAEGELDSTDIKSIENWLLNPKVSKFFRDEFESPFQLDRERTVEWTHYFEIEYRLPGNAEGETQKTRIYLSDPIGGSTQFVGSEDSDLIGLLPREYISILAPLFKAISPVEATL